MIKKILLSKHLNVIFVALGPAFYLAYEEIGGPTSLDVIKAFVVTFIVGIIIGYFLNFVVWPLIAKNVLGLKKV